MDEYLAIFGFHFEDGDEKAFSNNIYLIIELFEEWVGMYGFLEGGIEVLTSIINKFEQDEFTTAN